MKIAAVSEDSITISHHFGRAPFYIVAALENSSIVSTEKRDKMSHAQFGEEAHAAGEDPCGNGFDPAAHSCHASMAAAIADCQVLLARGMGAGAYASMRQVGIQPVVTEIASIDEAVRAYLAGTLIDHIENLH
jgi:predicted Fe-Mo cluster-binding NifX family protein